MRRAAGTTAEPREGAEGRRCRRRRCCCCCALRVEGGPGARRGSEVAGVVTGVRGFGDRAIIVGADALSAVEAMLSTLPVDGFLLFAA